MKMKSVHRTLCLWIACCAILMNALAPSISHALSSSAGVPLTWDICRADGSRASFTATIEGLTADITARKLAILAVGEDCAYCVSHAGSFGLPPGDLRALAPAVPAASFPFLFYRSPQPLAVWSAAHPRGPPAPA